jgi:rubrerythrin
MKYEAWICPKCGYRLLTPDPEPVCDCGELMAVIEDPDRREEFARDVHHALFGGD